MKRKDAIYEMEKTYLSCEVTDDDAVLGVARVAYSFLVGKLGG